MAKKTKKKQKTVVTPPMQIANYAMKICKDSCNATSALLTAAAMVTTFAVECGHIDFGTSKPNAERVYNRACKVIAREYFPAARKAKEILDNPKKWMKKRGIE